ncbi:MAG TPA: DUF362 domain-containing protein [Acidobacteriota bacterium]
MKPAVHLIDQSRYDTEEIRTKVARAMHLDGFDPRGKTVFVKPSFVYPARPPRQCGVNTQPEVVAGVVRALRDRGARRVWVGEDCLVGASQTSFVAMGVLPLLSGQAQPLYLKDEDRVTVEVSRPLVENRFFLPRKFVEADLFVSLPKLKVNMHAAITLSVKNHMGLLLLRDRLPHHHYDLHKKIADLYRTRLPDYTVTDAVLAGEGQGPMYARPVPLHLLLAGTNGLAVDVAACRLAGFDPRTEVEHLRILHGFGLGPLDLADIEFQAAGLLDERRRRLERPRVRPEPDFPASMVFCVGRELACVEGCLGMVRGSLDRWYLMQNFNQIKGMAFIVGRPVTDIPAGLHRRRTFVVGDCASEHRRLGTFIPGCPVNPMALTYAFLKKGIHGPLHIRLREMALGLVMRSLGRRRPGWPTFY